MSYIPSPTVFPTEGFNARGDAEVLRKAMKGFGTDEKAIIQVLANRTLAERLEIAVQFKTMFGKDLIKDLKSETSGKFRQLLVALMTRLPHYYARELHDAMSGLGTDENVLIEVLCTMTNHEICVIKQVYAILFKNCLEDDLKDDTSGNFKKLMVSLSCANRDESDKVDKESAEIDARQLINSKENKSESPESVFHSILVRRNFPQLYEIFNEYLNISGTQIETAIENQFSGDIKNGFLAIVKNVKNRAQFFAEQLYDSMKGLGTDDRRLMRLIISRSEIDMGDIKKAFMLKYGKTLEDMISGDTSGDYKKCLLALIKRPKN